MSDCQSRCWTARNNNSCVEQDFATVTVEPVKMSWKSYSRVPSEKLNGVQAGIRRNGSMVSSHLVSEESGRKLYVCKYQVILRLAEMHCVTHVRDSSCLRIVRRLM